MFAVTCEKSNQSTVINIYFPIALQLKLYTFWFTSSYLSGQTRAPQAVRGLQGELGSGGDYAEGNSGTTRRSISHQGVIDDQRNERAWFLCDTLTVQKNPSQT